MSSPAERLDKLKCLLADTTCTRKHSAYQLLAAPVAKLLGDTGVEVHSKHERERLNYMRSKVEFCDKAVLDIGCNTGFFLFELLQAGASRVTGYEGSPAHAAFVSEAASLLGLHEAVEVHSQYFEFDLRHGRFDVALLLNVLHHVGDDYGDPALTIEQARVTILGQLNGMSCLADRLVFQLGFNWRGDPAHCLFSHGTKAEMIDYIRQGTSKFWEIEAIGVAQRQNGELVYSDINDHNVQRDDALGEFLNRPIFIMKSLGSGN
ncbi:class I SAM-dependent methyltransferase [Pseudomonas sp. JM0905a]|uniref:class I SAM-dependent methyltransferase n=1 Tax=Pseudomonas sp. JM0905a TaxID=2772484 RepID=UPI001687A364|nr:class I SAM-dependent methyltransferase [Pseudomonas sp. JM0905a]MBD2837641.1 class I SAM-dependent methyltransferase [Pseudomonas sp. JM0905a]